MGSGVQFKAATYNGIPVHVCRVNDVPRMVVGCWFGGVCAGDSPHLCTEDTCAVYTLQTAINIRCFPTQTSHMSSFWPRLLTLLCLTAASSTAMLSLDPRLCDPAFSNTRRSSLDPSCPRACSSSVELIRLLRVSFFKTTDHPGIALSCTKNTCNIVSARSGRERVVHCFPWTYSKDTTR